MCVTTSNNLKRETVMHIMSLFDLQLQMHRNSRRKYTKLEVAIREYEQHLMRWLKVVTLVEILVEVGFLGVH